MENTQPRNLGGWQRPFQIHFPQLLLPGQFPTQVTRNFGAPAVYETAQRRKYWAGSISGYQKQAVFLFGHQNRLVVSSDYRAPCTPASAAAASSLLSSFPLAADLTLLASTSFEKIQHVL